MLKDIYSFKDLDLDIAQTLIAIVLDYQGQFIAAKRVLTFCPKRAERDHYDMEFLALAQRRKQSYLATVINVFYNQKLLQNGRTRNNAQANAVSLRDLNVSISEKELYNEIMVLLTSQESLIIHYMRTEMFFREFKKWLRTNDKYKYDNFGRKNNLTEAKCRELLVPVISRIRAYSEDSYQPETMNPDAFLFNVLNLYFKDTARDDGTYSENSDVTQFFKILNTRGQDREISSGEDGSTTTALNFFGVDLNATHSNLDFHDIAVKICKASKELYTHNNNIIAFYDIFSRYRDIVFSATKCTPKLKRAAKGCDIEKYNIYDSFSNANDSGTTSSMQSKCSWREEYLSLFNKILITGGVSMREIKLLYDDQIKVSRGMDKREMRCIYNVEGTNVKGDFKNSERFKRIYEGFIALKDFLDFINSDANTYGISVYNFDTRIFRDLRFANAVTDLEAYLSYGDLTYELITEEPVVYDRIFMKQNKEVQRDLYSIKNVNVFALLRDTPLDSIQKIQEEEERQLAEQNAFTNNIMAFTNKVLNFSPALPYNTENFKCPSDFVCDYILKLSDDEFQEFDRIPIEQATLAPIPVYKSAKGVFNINDPKHFTAISRYLSAVEILMALDGVPMINTSGWFEFDNVDIIRDYLDEAEDKYVYTFNGKSIYVLEYNFRELFINSIFTAFFGEVEDVPYWQKLRILFSLNNFLICLISDLKKICNNLKNYEKDPTAVYINMCDYLDLLEFDPTAFSLNKLYRIYNQTRLLYHTGECFSPDEAKMVKKIFETYLTKFYVRLFSEPENKSYFEILKRIKNEMYDTFKPKGSLQDADLKQKEKLREINENLRTIYTSYTSQIHNEFFCNDEDVLAYFKSCANFNDFGFAICNGKIYSTNNGTSFLHELGVVVTLDVFDKGHYKPLAMDDIYPYERFKK